MTFTPFDLSNEHRHGWLILKENLPVGELSYVGIDSPFYLFRFSCAPGTSVDNTILNSTSRPPDSKILFRNRETGREATDLDFCVHPYDFPGMEDPLISLRDFRVKDEDQSKPKKVWLQLVRLLTNWRGYL